VELEEKRKMALELWAIGVAFVANAVVGVGLVLGVYQLMERRLLYGALGGLVLGAVIVYGEATIGRQLFDLTFGEKRTIIVVAGVAAALGLTGTLMTVKPEVE
jgi:hypothetical protein